ncbi:hypothetical protein NDU88_006361 [Pleurodeles waltl]|uniref:Uncharacterized protein n=1 Tax=Pleurodeles waltl TaxID=8319 RepID=A0AAV7LNW9_PLEWA|nr:hypothetical protein NDU88_006361 [Pleurodeles waltl]
MAGIAALPPKMAAPLPLYERRLRVKGALPTPTPSPGRNIGAPLHSREAPYDMETGPTVVTRVGLRVCPASQSRPVLTRSQGCVPRDPSNRARQRLKVRSGSPPCGEEQRQRAAFSAVKKKLRELGVAYTMQFPDRLRVVTPTGVQFFLMPQKA